MAETRDIESVPVKKGQVEQRHSRAEPPMFEMERLLNRLFPRHEWFAPMRRWADWPEFGELAPHPRIDVIDEEARVLVRAEVPGVEKDDLEITLTDDSVILAGKTRHEERKEEGEMLYHERREGEFKRTIVLPARIDGEKAKAHYRDGMLELTLPKMERSQRRRIEIER
jgi:HSP20 family protein